jgi:hypothetical protein
VILKDPAKGEKFINHRPPGLEIVKAIQGFLQFKSAEGLSVRTIESYSHDLQQWVEYQGPMDIPTFDAPAHNNPRTGPAFRCVEFNGRVQADGGVVRIDHVALGDGSALVGGAVVGKAQETVETVNPGPHHIDFKCCLVSHGSCWL